jgi:microcystin degradation protein MlrC
MRVFIACLGTETNSFAPVPTGYQTFAETMLFHGDATKHEATGFSEPLHLWRKLTEERQGTVIESVAAFAQPGGPTVRKVYEDLRDEMLADLKAALPVDMVLLVMHGAMIADGYDDCEGDMLERARGIVGPDITVGVELDLHCSITAKMRANADAMITFKEYPHVDGVARARELFDLCDAARLGTVTPVTAVHDCRMINMWRTPVEPTKSIVAEMQAMEGRDGVLSVSFAHGFPWGDVPDASAKIIVITDGDADKAQAVAKRVGQRVWEARDAALAKGAGIDETLDRAVAATNGPVVLADIADNAGGGAASDATHLLEAVIRRGVADVLTGYYWDPIAVRFCKEVGEGAVIALRIGGKCGPGSGQPVDLEVKVEKIVEGAGQTFGTSRNRMGDAVWVSAGNGLDIVLNDVRTQVFNPDGFTQLGLDPGNKKIVIVKSTQHFYAGFAPIASEVIYVSCPGSIPPDFAAIPYQKFTDAYWPRVADPFA